MGAEELAEIGFPVAEVAAHHWANWVAALKSAGKELGEDLLIDGQAPKCGQIFRNSAMAQTLKVPSQAGTTWLLRDPAITLRVLFFELDSSSVRNLRLFLSHKIVNKLFCY